ncbi:TerC family protein [Buchnera aphidicola]|uniref:UPF0053 inner membrane protein YoaE n=1 Tax=Buchnera aphidicola (Cinara strobi) TaxID=1921549 RepID=A0A3B1E0N0_9GAMM|nr:transporter associated domain-containing protein [Buchnera aphidicola]VAX76575.1 UPF0053 inner membrane protein YoaE [Buchnera aphidicola (Cinara strobi)]
MPSFLDPSILAGLFTLIFLEIILSIDNIIFIAILSKKLPQDQRDKAQYTGLILALFMRCGLLFITSRLVHLTKPILVNKLFVFSAKELILLVGGIFLFIKVILELFHHTFNIVQKKKKPKPSSNFWYVVFQIAVLDAIFSIDSVMTAVGMIDNWFLIIFSVTISTIIMIFLSKILVKFIHSQKTITTLCLSLLLVISINLILESLGIYISPKHLYISIIFAVFIEIINQVKNYNSTIFKKNSTVREKFIDDIHQVINKNQKYKKNKILNFKKNTLNNYQFINNYVDKKIIHPNEINTIINIIKLGDTNLQEIMIPKEKITWININSNYEDIKKIILRTSYKLLPICNNQLNDVIGIVSSKKLISVIDNNEDIYNFSTQYPPIIIPDTLNIIHIFHILLFSKKNIFLINNEQKGIEGLIKPIDIFKKIIGKFPTKIYNIPKIILNPNHWIMQGSVKIRLLKEILNLDISKLNKNCSSLADLLIEKCKKIPKTGENIYFSPYHFKILKSNSYQIHLVKITKDITKKYS